MSSTYIHPTAHISSNVSLGDNTKVWINAQIRENTAVGENCIISKDVYIDHGVHIGSHCKIQNGVSIYNGVTIKDKVFVGPYATFTNDKVPRAFNQAWEITPTTVEIGASIGANATIVCGITIGEYAMIAAGSVVTKNVPRHALVMGNPAKVTGYVCECGNHLDKNHQCVACGKTIQI